MNKIFIYQSRIFTPPICSFRHDTNFCRSFCRPLIRDLVIAISSFLFWGVSHADERLWIRATINGKHAHFYFDTGASDLVLFPEGAKRLGLSFTNAPKVVHLKPGELAYGRTEECALQIGVGVCRTSFHVLEIPKMLSHGFAGGGDGSTTGFAGNRVARAIFRTFEVMVASLTGGLANSACTSMLPLAVVPMPNCK